MFTILGECNLHLAAISQQHLSTGLKRDFRACLVLQARRREIVPTARDRCGQQQEAALGLTKRRPNVIDI